MPPFRLFVLAGEASGDQIGAALIAGLRKKRDVELSGVGGKAMTGRGMRSLFPMTDLAVMGYVDVLTRLPLLLWRLHQALRAILEFDPDVVVLIDSQQFSVMLAKRLKKRGFTKPILLYVAPTVWVYKPERAEKIRPLYDEILAILPFEPQVLKDLGGPKTSFVGHPALPEKDTQDTDHIKNRIAIMPGSRMGELNRHLSMFGEVAASIHERHPELEFYIPTLDYLADYLKAATSKWSIPVSIVTQRQEREALYLQTKLGIVVSGTATLELAFSGVPMVVAYVMDVGQRQRRRKLDIAHISLPNIILDDHFVPELLLNQPDADQVFKHADELLSNPEMLQRQIRGFAQMTNKMRLGTPDYPRVDPVDIVLSHAQTPKA